MKGKHTTKETRIRGDLIYEEGKIRMNPIFLRKSGKRELSEIFKC